MQRLSDRGVQTLIHYAVPVHRQPLYLSLGYGQVSMPESERAASQVLSIPVHPALTDGDLDRIVDAVRKVAASA